MAELNLRKAKRRTIIIGKDGSLKTVAEYEQISLGHGSYSLGKRPYFLNISEIREVAYCSENICTRRAYRIWHNMIYRAGYAETMIGEPRRRLDTPGLEQADQYFWNLVFESPIKDKMSVRKSTGRSLNDPRLMIEMLPKALSFGHP